MPSSILRALTSLSLYLSWVSKCMLTFGNSFVTFSPVQVTQLVGYIGTLPVIRINESMAEWTARDCYVSLLAALPPFSSNKLLRN